MVDTHTAASSPHKLGKIDIAIVGGGLVGQALALALRDLPLRVVQFEAAPEAKALPSLDPARERYLALNARSFAVLQQLGLQFSAARLSPIRSVLITRQGEFGQISLDAAREGLDRLGTLIPASELALRLNDALVARTVERHFDHRLQAIVAHEGESELHFVHGSTGSNKADASSQIRARLVIGADGTESTVRRLAGLSEQRRDYGSNALVFNVSVAQPHQCCAFERFTDRGPLALLPLPLQRMGVVWTLPEVDARALQALGDRPLCHALHAAFGYRLGAFSAPSPRTVWPLLALHAQPDFTERCILLGNAAQTVHPLGAQGFNLGLRDVMALRTLLAAPGQDLAQDLSELPARYSAIRAQDRRQTREFSDQSLVASSSATPAARWLRQLGFAAFNSMPLAERSLIRFGLGFTR